MVITHNYCLLKFNLEVSYNLVINVAKAISTTNTMTVPRPIPRLDECITFPIYYFCWKLTLLS